MDQLNQYVMMEIFDYLDAASLKSCAEASPSWDKMIGTSLSTMKKLPLIVDQDRLGTQNAKLKEIKRLKRKHLHLMIDDLKLTCKMLAPLKLHTQHMRILEFTQVEFTEQSWKGLLQTLQSVEKMTIVDSRISAIKRGAEIVRVALPTLKSLAVIDSDWSFFAYLKETSIEQLKIQHRGFSIANIHQFSSFLEYQEHLTSLAIRVHQILFYQVLANAEDFKFRLKMLCVSYKHFSEEINANELVNLLEIHKDTLEYFEADCKLRENIYEFIFGKLKLNTLILNASYFPHENVTFYTAFRENAHLKKLVLTGEFNQSISAQGFFHIYRQIEDLSIMNWSATHVNDILVSIINALSKLSNLKIPFLVDNTPELTVSSLKQLTIESVTNKNDLKTFVMNQSNLEKLSIKWIHEDINDVIEEIAPRLKSLRQAYFGAGFQPTLESLKAFKENCPDLRALEIFHNKNSTVTSELLNEVNGKGLKVVEYEGEAVPKIFPVHKGLWFEEDKLYSTLAASTPASDTESMDDDNDDFGDSDDDDYDFYDSDDYDNPFFHGRYGGYDSDSDFDLQDYVMRDVIEFLLH